MLQSGLVAVLIVHLLAVNLASAGPLVGIWLFWKAWRRADRACASAGRRLIVWSLAAVGVGILTGGVALALAWSAMPGFFAAAGRLPASRYWFGGVELVFYVACLAGVLRISRVEDLVHRRRFWGIAALLVLAGLDLVYHFPPLFVGLNVLASRPDDWTGPVHFVQLLVDPQVAAMVLHFVLAAAAAGGVALMLLAKADDAPTRERLVTAGARLTLGATILQLPVGALVLFHLPPASRDALLGGDALASVLFGLALVATLGLLQRTAGIALGETEPRAVRTAALWFALIVLLMVVAQQRAAGLLAAGAVS
ncbi:MAG TPA: hypothetical protein VIK18_12960 [Pirellulales bacterium]